MLVKAMHAACDKDDSAGRVPGCSAVQTQNMWASTGKSSDARKLGKA